MEPIKSNFDIESFEKNSTEKIINKIIEINDCNKSSENNDLNHALKNQAVELLINERIENGVINNKTLIITYRNEYENNKLINPNEVKDLINPLNEKTLNVCSLIKLTALIFLINSVKQIFILKIFSPISLMANESKELKSKI